MATVRRHKRWLWAGRAAPFCLVCIVLSSPVVPTSAAFASAQLAQAPSGDAAATEAQAAAQPSPQRWDIFEYRIEGADLLSQADVEAAVYPFLGPDRTPQDVEDARAALEKAYFDKGYQTIAVAIPPQSVRHGIVTLKVTEGKVGRLRVRGSRYFDLEAIKAAAPSLAEGTVPNLQAVTEDIIALNQVPDRRVTPMLKPGVAPGTVDVDLQVEDTFPLHGSLELNNRYSEDTSELRLNAALRYDNLWQLGHSISVGYQVAPERRADSEVFSGSYLSRFPSLPWFSLLAYGVKQDSDVSTLGGINVAGQGEIIGGRGLFTLPGGGDFFHTLAVGIDYKRFRERVSFGGEDGFSSPITYYPLTADYSATWIAEGSATELGASVIGNIRSFGSDREEFDNRRFNATGGFVYFRGDASHLEELPFGTQGFAKVQGQFSNDALISSEQFSAGGLDTVRGYLESEALGDSAALGRLEFRSPSLTDYLGDDVLNDWRFHLFVDAGRVFVNDALPEQQDRFDLWSFGAGTRVQLLDYVNGSFDFAVPMIAQESTERGDPRALFRVWLEF